jgi:hypothetical protein
LTPEAGRFRANAASFVWLQVRKEPSVATWRRYSSPFNEANESKLHQLRVYGRDPRASSFGSLTALLIVANEKVRCIPIDTQIIEAKLCNFADACAGEQASQRYPEAPIVGSLFAWQMLAPIAFKTDE